MTTLLWNIILALTWAALTGDLSPANLMIGFAAGWLALLMADPSRGPGTYARRVLRAFRFGAYYMEELFRSNLSVAWDVLDPRLRARPAVVAVPLETHTDEEILILTSLLTFTPGSLVLDISEDRTTLYVHVMDARNLEEIRTMIKDEFERRVIEVMR